MTGPFVFVSDTEAGGKLADSLLAAGFELADRMEAAEVFFTYFLSHTALEDAYFDSGGLLSVAPAGACFIDLSPSCPTFARELYALAQMGDVQLLDAPLVIRGMCETAVLSDPTQLSLYVGGEEKVFKRYQGMLEALAAQVHHLGMVGTGQIAKASATTLFAAQLVALVEMTSFAQDAEASSASLVAALSSDDLVPSWMNAVIEAISEGKFQGSYTILTLMAELTAALRCADDADLTLPQAEACVHLLELFLVVGGGDLNVAALSLLYNDQADTDSLGIDWSRAEQLFELHEDAWEQDEEEFGSSFEHDHVLHREGGGN